jgi:rhodanese-related sulfurtransferase
MPLFSRRPEAQEGDAQYRDPEKLKSLLETDGRKALVLDVRTAEEFAAGHIPGSENINYVDLPDSPPDVPKDRLIILYCHTGMRSHTAARMLAKLGFSRLVNFGGVVDWPYGLVEGSDAE